MSSQVQNGRFVADIASSFMSKKMLQVVGTEDTITIAFGPPFLDEYGVFLPIDVRENSAQGTRRRGFEPRHAPSS